MFDFLGQTSNFEVGPRSSMFHLLDQTSNFEVGVWTSMFDLLGQTSNFGVESRTSMFDLLNRTSNFEVGIWTSMFNLLGPKSEFGLQCSIFWVKHRTSKSNLALQCSTFWVNHGIANSVFGIRSLIWTHRRRRWHVDFHVLQFDETQHCLIRVEKVRSSKMHDRGWKVEVQMLCCWWVSVYFPRISVFAAIFFRFVLCSFSQMEQQRVPENLIMGFFRKLETIRFPEDIFAQHTPELVSTWDAIGRTQSVSWPL